MAKPLLFAGLALLGAIAACGSSGGAPQGAVTDCGTIAYRGGRAVDGATAEHNAAQCFVTAVHSCHAARLQLNVMGVDTGTTEVLTVRRASHHSCVTAVADTSSVLGRGDTHRHQVCRTATVDVDGVDLSDCR